MRVGLMCNTVCPARTLGAAADLLVDHGAELILHCGDMGTRDMLDVLAKYDAAFIWGDRDQDRMGLLRYAQKHQLTCYGMLASIELGGKQVALCHGDDPKLVRRLLDEQQHDYLFTGHSLVTEDYKVGKTRILSAGGLQEPARRTVVLLDLATDEVGFLSPEEQST